MKTLVYICFVVVAVLGDMDSARAAGVWCGLWGKDTVVIDMKYTFFPAELEGDSWVSRPKHGTKDCTGSFKSIVLEVYYPGMESAGRRNVYNDPDKRHVSIHMVRLNPATSSLDFTGTLQRYMPHLKAGQGQAYGSEEAFSLQKYSGVDPVYKTSLAEIYWSNSANEVDPLYIICRFHSSNFRTRCLLHSKSVGTATELRVGFSYHMLSQWETILDEAKILIGVIKGRER